MDSMPVHDSPYRDIQPFRYVDRAYFFGREQEVEDLLLKVMLYRLVVLFGGSGAGKSSLVNAGLIPALEKQGFAPERLLLRPDGPILVQRIRVGGDGRFLPSEVFPDRDGGERVGDAEFASYSLKAFQDAVRASVSKARPVLILDQFEELFTLFDEKSPAIQKEVLDTIFTIINDPQLGAKVIISIREDFLGRLEVLAKEYPRVFEQRLRLEPLSTGNARKAILGPFGAPVVPGRANPFPSRLSEGLADEQIIPELSNEPPAGMIHPTQLQIVCDRLWRVFSGDHSEITETHSRSLGGVKGILEGYLEYVLGRIDAGPERNIIPSLRRHAVMVLRNLVIDSKYRDVVSENRLETILADTGAMSADELKNTLEFLERHRLINRTPRAGTFYCDIASEYIIPAIEREARELDNQLAIEREQIRLHENAERNAQTRFANRLRQRLYVAVGLGAVALLFALGVGYLFLEVKAKTKALEATLEKERQLQRQLSDALKKESSLRGDYQKQTIALAETVNERDAALRSEKVERVRAIAGELRQRASNMLGAEPESSVLLALRSSLVARQDRRQSVDTEGQDPETDGLLLRTVQAVVAKPRLRFARALRTELSSEKQSARAMAFSSDGGRLVAGGDDGTVRVWDAVHGELLLTLQYPGNSKVLGVAFTSDGKRIVAVGSDGLVAGWDAQSGAEGLRVDTNDPLSGRRAVLADGAARYVVIEGDGKITRWAVFGGNRIQSPLPTSVTCPDSVVSISPSGERIACADAEGKVKVEPPLGVGSFRLSLRSMKKLVFSGDSKQLVAIDGEGRIALCDVESGRSIWQGVHKGATTASFGHDGKIVATGSENGSVEFRDVRTGEVLHSLPAVAGSIELLTMSRDGRRIAVSGTSGGSSLTRLWEFPIAGYRDEAASLALSSDGRMVAIGTGTGAVRVVFVSSGLELLNLKARDRSVLSLAFSPDGHHLATGFADGGVTVWDVWSGKRVVPLLKTQGIPAQGVPESSFISFLRFLGLSNSVRSIAFSSDGRRVVTGDQAGNAEIWDMNSGERAIAMPTQFPAAVYAVALDRQGTRLVTGNEAGVAMVFDSRTGKVLSSTAWQEAGPKRRGGEIRNVAFAPDGKRFLVVRRLSGFAQGVTVEVWDAQSDSARLDFEVSKSSGAAFSEDGTKLITVASDGTVQTRSARGGQKPVTVMATDPVDGGVVFDSRGRFFAVASKRDGVGIFGLGGDLAFEWALIQMTRSPERSECDKYLTSTARECRQLLEVLDHIAGANGQLTKRNWREGIASYEMALQTYSALPRGLGVQLRRFVAETLAVDGRNALRAGDEKDALRDLRLAQGYDQVLISNPESALRDLSDQLRDERRRAVAEVSRSKGEEAARKLILEETIRHFKDAEATSPGLFGGRAPESEAKKLVWQVRISLAVEDARAGRIPKAIQTFREAGDEPEATISASSWNTLCWRGSLHKFASAVVDDACETAVKKAPGDVDVLDSRGVARAMTGRIQGAIDDFSEFIRVRDASANRERRERWVRDLRSGRNPFTDEEIEILLRGSP